MSSLEDKSNTLSLSLVVPVYKAEPYIERCVRSLMEQTMHDGLEFLFINDCTPDRSIIILREVLDEYPSRKQQVRIIENERHLGISQTRTIALSACRGAYIGWCDSDDWLEKEACQKMWDGTEDQKNDIVVINYWLEQDNRLAVIHNHSVSPRSALANSWKPYYLPLGLPFQIIKKELLQNAANCLIVTDQGEDTYMIRYVYYWAETINFLPDILYHYDRSNLASITHSTTLSFEEWECHKQNIDTISKVLSGSGSRFFSKSINHLKYIRKYQYRTVFHSLFSYYHTYRECYKDINLFLDTQSGFKWKTYIVYNLYPLFWLYFHKTWKH